MSASSETSPAPFDLSTLPGPERLVAAHVMCGWQLDWRLPTDALGVRRPWDSFCGPSDGPVVAYLPEPVVVPIPPTLAKALTGLLPLGDPGFGARRALVRLVREAETGSMPPDPPLVPIPLDVAKALAYGLRPQPGTVQVSYLEQLRAAITEAEVDQ